MKIRNNLLFVLATLVITACGGGGTPPDTTAPTVTLTAAKTTIESGDTVALTLSAQDDRDTSVTPTLSCNAGTLSGTQLATTRSATATTIACQASARDLAGNTGQATVNITVNPTLGKLALVAGQDKITPRKATLFEAPGIPLESASYSGSIEGTPVTLHRNIDGQTLYLLVPDGIAAGARWIDVQMGNTRQSLSLTITDLPAIANVRTVAVEQLQAVIAQARADLMLASTNDVFTPEFHAVFVQNLAAVEQTLAGIDTLSAADQRAVATLLLANFAAIPRTPETPVASAPGTTLQKVGIGVPRLAAISPQEPQCTESKVNLITSLSVAIPTLGVLVGVPGTPLDKAVQVIVGGLFSVDAYRSLKKYLASCIEFRDDALETEVVSRFLERAAKAQPGDPQYVLSAVAPISLGFTNRQTSNFRIKRRFAYPGSTSPSAVVAALQRLMAIFSTFRLSPPEALTAARDKVVNGYSEYIPASGVAISGISRPDIGGSATGSDLRLGLRFVISDPQEESYPFTFTLSIPGGEPIPVNATLSLKLPVVTPGGLTVTQGKSASSLVTFQNATSLEVVTRPTNGAVSLANDGTFSYSPNGQFFGTDSFTYRGRNLDGVSKPETVSISVVRQFEGPWMISVKDSPNEPCTDVKDLETTASISKASDTLYLTSYRGTPIELRMSSVDDPAGLSGTATVTYPEDNGTTVQSLSISVPNSTTLSGGGSWTWTRPATDTMPAMNCTGGTAITGTRPAG